MLLYRVRYVARSAPAPLCLPSITRTRCMHRTGAQGLKCFERPAVTITTGGTLISVGMAISPQGSWTCRSICGPVAFTRRCGGHSVSW